MDKFIYTNNEETKEKLVSSNYKLITKNSNGFWVFENKNEMKFEKIDGAYTSSTLTF